MRMGLLIVAGLLLGSSCNPANRAPSIPTVTGPFVGAYEIIFFSVTSSDPDGDPIAFEFEWGDTTTVRWSDFSASGETLTVGHNYPDSGVFLFRTRAQDTTGMKSDWCAPETVIPSGKTP